MIYIYLQDQEDSHIWKNFQKYANAEWQHIKREFPWKANQTKFKLDILRNEFNAIVSNSKTIVQFEEEDYILFCLRFS